MFSSTYFGPHRSNFRSVFVQAVCADLVCGTTVRTTRHVQLLLRNGWTCRVVRVLPQTKSAHTACKKNAPEVGAVRSEIRRAKHV